MGTRDEDGSAGSGVVLLSEHGVFREYLRDCPLPSCSSGRVYRAKPRAETTPDVPSWRGLPSGGRLTANDEGRFREDCSHRAAFQVFLMLQQEARRPGGASPRRPVHPQHRLSLVAAHHLQKGVRRSDTNSSITRTPSNTVPLATCARHTFPFAPRRE